MWWLLTPETVFHITSTTPMPLKLTFPLYRRMTICQVNCVVRVLSPKAIWTRLMTQYRCLVSGYLSLVVATIHPCSCSVCIQNFPPSRCHHRHQTAHSISPPWGIESSMVNGSIPTDIPPPPQGGETHVYSTKRSTVTLVMVTRLGGGGRLVVSL